MDLITTLLLVFVSITIGFLLNALISVMRKGPGEAMEEKEPVQASAQAEGVRIWRDPPSQKLQVDMGGKVFQSAVEMSDEQRSQLAGIAAGLETWIHGMRGPVSDLSQPPAGVPPVMVQQSQLQPDPMEYPSKPAEVEPERMDLNPFKVFTRAFRPAEKSSLDRGPDSIVAQIDALLQARLEGTPLAKRGIRLVENPGGGMVVVGLESFESIEAIPDGEVRAVIRQAVAEWEERPTK